MAEVKSYKVLSLPSRPSPDSIYWVKGSSASDVIGYITDRNGVPYPLKDLQGSGQPTELINTDGNLVITGANSKTINIAPALLSLINSALQSGANISELVNDEGFITLVDIPTNVSEFTNDAGYLTTFTETDPIFQASEASNFVAGDKTNLDNQSGVNSGDETTSSIQTKRPLKTINGDSLEGTGNLLITTPDVTGYVPYTGATTNVDLGEFELKAGQVEFDQTPTGTAGVGVMRWNNADGTLDLGLKGGNVTLQVGQEQVLRVINKTATNITLLESNYQAVRVTGAQGQRLKVDLAQATSDLLSAETIGLVTETIANNQEGFITTSGLIRGINTTGSLQGETWVDGNVLYLSPTVAGRITNVKPSAPSHLVIIGYVVHAHATQGSIFVKVDNGYELDELHNVSIDTPLDNQVLTFETSSGLWKNKNAAGYESSHPNFVEVNALTDLPTAVAGVITLTAGYTYLFLKHIDLLGSRLVCGQDTVIVGWSSENCSITSTGLSGSTALVTSTHSLPVRNISFTHPLVFNLQGDGVTTALDWFGVNLLNCASGGTIQNYTNFVAGDSALLNSGGFTFDGTIGTIAFSNCLFDTATGSTAINILSTCTVTRRLRVIYSSFVTLSGETGVNFNTAATVGDEKYILDTCNFSGGGTYVTGVDAASNKALFANCVGITNTSTRGFMHMIDNTTATSITGTASYFKAAGTTTAGVSNSKFAMPASNRLTYTGAFSQSFFVTLNCNVRTSVSTQTINIVIAKNGTRIPESEMTILCAAGSTPSFGGTQAVVELVANDFIELYVRNTSSVNNVIVSDLNMNILKIPV